MMVTCPVNGTAGSYGDSPVPSKQYVFLLFCFSFKLPWILLRFDLLFIRFTVECVCYIQDGLKAGFPFLFVGGG